MIHQPCRTLMTLLFGGAVLASGACTGSLLVDTGHAAPDDDDDTTGADDDDATSGDDDDDATPGDDDDTTAADDDDSEPDMSYWDGTRTVFVDFADYAEEYWEVVDCEAPYDLVGPNVTGQYQSLCPLCWSIFQLSHNPDPLEEVEACVTQVYWEASSFERLYGIQMLDDTTFALWRNFGNLDAPLEEYGTGEIDGDTFWYTTDASDYGWYSYWAEGTGTFGQ